LKGLASIPKRAYAYVMADPDANGPEPAPAPDYSDDGVDLSLIRWMLSLTPHQRLRFLEDRINEILAIHELNARD
jgi:hypothetical protein